MPWNIAGEWHGIPYQPHKLMILSSTLRLRNQATKFSISISMYPDTAWGRCSPEEPGRWVMKRFTSTYCALRIPAIRWGAVERAKENLIYMVPSSIDRKADSQSDKVWFDSRRDYQVKNIFGKFNIIYTYQKWVYIDRRKCLCLIYIKLVTI